jgi:outer membrane immunogenic protein
MWVGGGGIEWAFTGNWTVKAEYLFLGLTDRFSVCGAGAGAAAGSTFCADHRLAGIHTMKIGANYRLN